jgi:hypothetical protein
MTSTAGGVVRASTILAGLGGAGAAWLLSRERNAADHVSEVLRNHHEGDIRWLSGQQPVWASARRIER